MNSGPHSYTFIIKHIFILLKNWFKRGKVKIIAHRGASGYAPENSIEAIKLAIDMKADFVEIDVRRTRDGKLVVIHDGKVDRVTNGTGYISRLSLKQVRKFRPVSYTHLTLPTTERV